MAAMAAADGKGDGNNVINVNAHDPGNFIILGHGTHSHTGLGVVDDVQQDNQGNNGNTREYKQIT
jgi:hypothetical protein